MFEDILLFLFAIKVLKDTWIASEKFTEVIENDFLKNQINLVTKNKRMNKLTLSVGCIYAAILGVFILTDFYLVADKPISGLEETAVGWLIKINSIALIYSGIQSIRWITRYRT